MFARRIATVAPPAFHVVLDAVDRHEAAAIDRTFDEAAARGYFAAIIVPRLRGADEVADMIKALLTSERWSMELVQWRQNDRHRDVAIGMKWKTKAGDDSAAMGFAPLGSMPVSRRSPYVALVAWPGPRQNPFAKPQPGVGFIDATHGLTRARYDSTTKKSSDQTKVLFLDPPEDRVLLRRVAFCLPKATVASLR